MMRRITGSPRVRWNVSERSAVSTSERTPADPPRLARLAKLALALPEATRETMSSHAAFSVRGRKFAYYLDNHHGDGIVSVCFRAAPGINRELVASDSDRFYLPAYIAAKGWGALRLDRGRVDREEVRALVAESYRIAAPKRLAALVVG
jgi:phosphoribosylglycinamide formyltransferase-1